MADSRITELPVLSEASGSVLYAVKGGVDYQVSAATLQGSLQPQAANLVFAGPPTAPGDFPAFRYLVQADIPDLSSLYLSSTGGTLSGATINSSTIVNGTISGSTATFDDNKLTIRDQTDTTKTFQFDAASISAGTQRIFIMPDANTTLVGTDTSQNLTNKSVYLNTPTSAAASLRIPHGVPPTTPVNGDIWTTNAGIYVRINNATVGPLAAAASSTVITFNGRSGAVSLTSADVTGALGFIPVNRAGDTGMTNNFTSTGTFTGYQFTATGQIFQSSTPNVVLSPNSSGNVYLRPSGAGSATSEAILDSTGQFRIPKITLGGSAGNTGVPFDALAATNGRVLIRDTGSGNSTIDFVNAGNSAFAPGMIRGTGQPLALDFANVNASANINAGGQVTAAGGVFSSANTTVLLCAQSGGTVYLRPNGAGSNVGEVTVSSAGVTGGNYFQANGAIPAFQGTNTAILGTNTGGVVYLRPNGSGNTAGQASLSSAGQLTLNPTSSDYLSHSRGGYTFNWFNLGDGQTGMYDGVAASLAMTYNTTSGGSWSFRGSIYASGNITAFSDKALKKDVVTIANAGAKLDKLRGVEFTRIENGERDIGVIAQEVEAVIPEVVKQYGDSQYKSVAYGNMVGLLIEALKETRAEVKALKEKLGVD